LVPSYFELSSTTAGGAPPFQEMDPTVMYWYIQMLVANNLFKYSPVYVNLTCTFPQYVALPWGVQFLAPSATFLSSFTMPAFLVENIRSMGPCFDKTLGYPTYTYPVPVQGYQGTTYSPSTWVNSVYPATFDAYTQSFPTLSPPLYISYNQPAGGVTNGLFTAQLQMLALLSGLVDLYALNQQRDTQMTFSKFFRVVPLMSPGSFVGQVSQGGALVVVPKGQKGAKPDSRAATPPSYSVSRVVVVAGRTYIDPTAIARLDALRAAANDVGQGPYVTPRANAALVQYALASIHDLPQGQNMFMAAVVPVVPVYVDLATVDPISAVTQALCQFQANMYNITTDSGSIEVRDIITNGVNNYLHTRGFGSAKEQTISHRLDASERRGGALGMTAGRLIGGRFGARGADIAGILGSAVVDVARRFLQ